MCLQIWVNPDIRFPPRLFIQWWHSPWRESQHFNTCCVDYALVQCANVTFTLKSWTTCKSLAHTNPRTLRWKCTASKWFLKWLEIAWDSQSLQSSGGCWPSLVTGTMNSLLCTAAWSLIWALAGCSFRRSEWGLWTCAQSHTLLKKKKLLWTGSSLGFRKVSRCRISVSF